MFAIFAQTAQTSAAETQEAPVNAGGAPLGYSSCVVA
uniref:A1.2 n=1 Tax=Kalmanozyma brasiliensis TaxID=1392244 RepID=A0AA48P7D7_9BASI|nr:TPA_inf: a1.2 [Kalmanozyma brasiliensis]